MADEEERPYKAEYAKSGRAGCKQCSGSITKDTLRMAKMVQVSTPAKLCKLGSLQQATTVTAMSSMA